jgi:hypothetical protein
MSIRLPTAFLLLCLFMTACGKAGEGRISGKFWLFEHPTDQDTPDAIEFRADGTCLIGSGEGAGVAGKYHAQPDGVLKITADAGSQTEYTFNYQLLKYTLVLSKDGKPFLYYVRLPEGSAPQFTEIVGIFHANSDQGESAGEITADHKFRDHLCDLVASDHTYFDIKIDGTCSYSEGVVTYNPLHSDAPQQDKYLRDFIVKRDTHGLWVIDPFHDTIMCETQASNLDLAPPPIGYRNGR